MPRQARQAPVTAAACLACLLVFALNARGPESAEHLARLGALDSWSIWEGKLWGLFTTCFVHVEPMHLVFNLYWMWRFGLALEAELPRSAYLGLLVGAGLVSSAAQLTVSGSPGIGLSGIVYAQFGFLWLTRSRYPRFAQLLARGLVGWFLLWLVLCMAATWYGTWNVGNAAHLSGLLFGAGVGLATLHSRHRREAAGATLVASVLVLASTHYSPWNKYWTAWKAGQEHWYGDLAEAERWYLRTAELELDPRWVWWNLGRVRLLRGDSQGFESAAAQLEQLEPADANALRALRTLRDDLVQEREAARDPALRTAAEKRLADFDLEQLYDSRAAD